jgi:hypothetical protein
MRLFVTAGTSWTVQGAVRLRAGVHRWHGHATEGAAACIDRAIGPGSEAADIPLTLVRVKIGYVASVPQRLADGAKQTLPDPKQQRFALQQN